MSHINTAPRNRIGPIPLFIVFVLITRPVFAQTVDPGTAGTGAAMQEMMKRMSPGEGHQVFRQMIGRWHGSMKVWNSATPAAAPIESESETEVKLVLGGRFVVEEANGAVARIPMQRLSILGFDNVAQTYTLIFYSSLETATNIAVGTAATDGKSIILRGTFDEPEGKVPFKNVIRIESDDVRVFESYRLLPDGKEVRLVEETYTRIK